MRNAIFRNFTDKPFVGYWNGRPRTFKPGSETFMEEGLARHFAKHLANHVLLTEPDREKRKKNESYTSPKNPEQVPAFYELFSKAFELDAAEEEMDADQAAIDAANRRTVSSDLPARPAAKGKPQVIEPPEDDDDGFEEAANQAGQEQKADEADTTVAA